MDKTERQQKIEAYGSGPDLLLAALADIPREAWDYKPSARDWSVHEIIVHMADSESMAALRVRKLIVEPGTTLMVYDEDKWAGALDYQRQDVDDSLQLIRLARKSTYRLLRTLGDDVFSHTVKHPEYAEPYTFERWLDIYARHIPDHIAQIQQAFGAWKRKK